MPSKIDKLYEMLLVPPGKKIRLKKDYDPSYTGDLIKKKDAKQLLAESELLVTEICFEVGFESLGSFSTLFHRIVGWSPSIYRARTWEMRANPLKFIPNCYVIMHGIQVSGPKE